MSLIAAFLWRKQSLPNICTFIYDNENINIISSPKIYFISKNSSKFKNNVKHIISIFAKELKNFSETHDKQIIVEYKIVFIVTTIPWIKASNQSKFVLKQFLKAIHDLQYKSDKIILKPQLRDKLHGKDLNRFKRELRKMNLVSRKRDRSYEYTLWLIALHATSTTYQNTLRILKNKLMEEFWHNVNS